MEKTFIMIKPNAVQRNLIGDIITRFEKKGFMINAIKFALVTEEQAKKHYYVHRERPFYDELVQSIISNPVVLMVISGNNIIEMSRNFIGATNPLESIAGTIRGDFSNDLGMNIIHGSDSLENAEYEINIYFDKNDIINYKKNLNKDIFSN
jgi:nucleoside-diphosphate kinase